MAPAKSRPQGPQNSDAESVSGRQTQQELGALHQRLNQRRQALQQMQAQLAAAQADQNAAKQSCLAGVEAAHRQMVRMRAELEEVRRRQQSLPDSQQDRGVGEQAATVEEVPAPPLSSVVSASVPNYITEDKGRRQQLKLESRQLRQELIKWQHQVEVLEADLPRHETEIVRLKAELTHAHDVLESTRHAIRHLEVEHFIPHDEEQRDLGSTGNAWTVSVHPEATAERRIRQRAEEKNNVLVIKARRLTGVLAAQQLLIQRLEKQLLREEGLLEQRELRIAGSERLQAHLKGALRRRSDDVVASALLGRVSGLLSSSAAASTPQLPKL